jgi:tetratricopeptide (TPR) repeat protein
MSQRLTETSLLPVRARRWVLRPVAGLSLLLWCLVVNSHLTLAQGGQTLFGEVRVDSSQADNPAPISIILVLYRDGAGEVGRQSVSNRSRYRFINLAKGDYQLAVEVDNNEIGRLRIVIRELSDTPYGFQQDLMFSLKPRTTKAGVLSTSDIYDRSPANRTLFKKAHDAVEQKKYDDAISVLKRVVEADKLDFQAWTLLGTVYFVTQDFVDAEKAYLSALDVKPTFVMALLDLGKLRSAQGNYEAALEPLGRALEAQPQSADANLLLGEAYVKLKQGSKALPYLNEAVSLGRPEAHLLLGWLYDSAGRKDKAAVEYEQFLKKNPNYSDRKRLKDYISANSKS